MKLFISLLVFAVIQINNVCQADPCSTVDCGPNRTCRLQAVQCITSPCLPVAVCDSSVVDVRKCGPGSGPVLDFNRREIFCGRGPSHVICPDHTECKVDPADRFAVCCWKEENTAVTKPGSCPRPPPGYGICIVKCSHDGNCPGRQKCCGSCPRQCTEPVFKPKPGSCPTPPPGVGICIARCSNDNDCPGNLKCCGGCPLECKAPVFKPKPGRCPMYSWYRSCTNQIGCNSDSNCPANLKCCVSRCGKTCTSPTNQYPWWWWWTGGYRRHTNPLYTSFLID